MKKLALVIAAVITLTACNPIPSWVKPLLNLVLAPSGGTGVQPVPKNATTLSSAILIRRPAGANRNTRAVILDQEWKKYAKFFGKLCSVPAYAQGKSLPVFKEGSSQGGTTNHPLSVIYLIGSNPYIEAGSGMLVLDGWLTYALDTTAEWHKAHIQAWAGNTSLAIVP